jgi:phosphoribosylformimino-5-aminoimidazole carboxamide ribotide isomerase
MPFHVIPAIDLIDGKCVRLTQGDYAQKKVYNEDPLEVARSFEAAGLRHLHLVDLDGAKARRIVNWKVLERIAAGTGLHIDFGGGLRSDEDLRIAFEAGARQVTGGSVAVQDPGLFLGWLAQYGPDRIMLGADAKGGRVAINGWQEDSGMALGAFIGGYMEKGITHAICTDIEKDGMQQGPSFGLYASLLQEHPGLRLVASGGVGSADDLRRLAGMGMHGAIVGKAIYEGAVTLEELASIDGPSS